MKFAIAMRDNIVNWSMFYMGGRAQARDFVEASSPREVIGAGIIASIVGTERQKPRWDLYDTFYIASADQNKLMDLAGEARSMLMLGDSFSDVIVVIGNKLDLIVNGMARDVKEFIAMAKMLKLKVE